MKSISIFILAIIMGLTTEECSGVVINRYDCFVQSNNNNRCCFEPTLKLCKPYSLASEPTLDCGALTDYGSYEFTPYRPNQQVTGVDFIPCGRLNPKKKNDCTDYSHLMNSCCIFQNGNNNSTKGCYFLGKRYEGSYSEQSYVEGDNTFFFDCNSSALILPYMLLLLLFLYLF